MVLLIFVESPENIFFHINMKNGLVIYLEFFRNYLHIVVSLIEAEILSRFHVHEGL